MQNGMNFRVFNQAVGTRICGYCKKQLQEHEIDNHMRIWHKDRLNIEEAIYGEQGHQEGSQETQAAEETKEMRLEDV